MDETTKTLARDLWILVEFMQLANNNDAEMVAQAVYHLMGDQRRRKPAAEIADWCESGRYPQDRDLLQRAAVALREL